MRSHVSHALAATLFAAIAFCGSVQAHAQFSASQPGIPQQGTSGSSGQVTGLGSGDRSSQPDDPFNTEARRVKFANDDRHKRLLADTQKLLDLATALRDEVQKSSKDELNVDVVKKADEMEKLSRDIKDRMRY